VPSLPETILSAAALWLALILFVPKRNWRTVRMRLQATGSGERRHPFGPPLAPASDVSSRFLRLLASEAPRCLELGVPLWLATLHAEYVGWQRRRLDEARWASSPAGWIWAHLRGRIGEEELHRRLTDGGYPQPPAKARLRFHERHTAPPASWLPEPDDDALEPTSMPYTSTTASGRRERVARLSSNAPLVVQTLGTLKVCAGETDLTAELLAAPTASFLWQYLLLRAIHEPGRPIPRTVTADELYPGVERETQLTRLRKLIHRMQTKLPAISRSLVVTERDLMLDVEACQIDAVEILRLAADNRGTGLLPEPVVARIESAVAAAAAECLPDWDDLQQTINEGRGAAEEYVRSVRVRLQEARVALLARLGSHFLAHREAGRAAAILDEAFRLDPGRQGLAEELAKALEAAGHRARAADVRRRYVQRE
jgi:DNA-binding SARP family transcriptional activator